MDARWRIWMLGVAALMAALVLGGCATTGAATDAPAQACQPQLVAPPGARVFRGLARAGDPAEARERARLGALVEALKELGVEISSEMTDTWTHIDGVDRSHIEVRSRERVEPLEVRGARVAYCQAGARAVRAALAIPPGEWTRLARERRGRTLLVLQCRSEPAGGCDAALLERLRAAASGAGLAVASALAAPPEGVDSHSAEAMVALGREHSVARVLWLDVAAEFRTRHEGVLYAYTTIRGKLVETSDGKTLRTVAVEDVKGGVYEKLGHTRNKPDAAVRESVGEALEELTEEMAYWSG